MQKQKIVANEKSRNAFSSFLRFGRAKINFKELIRMSANLLCVKKFR
jgi:hypothetical protein